MTEMMVDISEGIIDGYDPEELTGEIFLQVINYKVFVAELEETKRMRKQHDAHRNLPSMWQ